MSCDTVFEVIEIRERPCGRIKLLRSAEIDEHLACGETILKSHRPATPLGNGEGGLSSIEAVSLGRGEQEQRVACHGEGGNKLDGTRGTNLGLPDTNKLLFVTMVDLDVPAPEVVLNDGLKRQSGIGADQIGGLAIKKAALRGEAIREETHRPERRPRGS